MQRGRKCWPIKGITRGLRRRIAATQVTWCRGQGCAFNTQHGSILILPTVECALNLVSVGPCPKILPPLNNKKWCLVSHLGTWAVSKRSYVLLVVWQGRNVGFHEELNFVCVVKENWSFTQLLIPVQQGYIPYFPAYNARVIYTKRIWNCKKWTCAVYVRMISDR